MVRVRVVSVGGVFGASALVDCCGGIKGSEGFAC